MHVHDEICDAAWISRIVQVLRRLHHPSRISRSLRRIRFQRLRKITRSLISSPPEVPEKTSTLFASRKKTIQNCRKLHVNTLIRNFHIYHFASFQKVTVKKFKIATQEKIIIDKICPFHWKRTSLIKGKQKVQSKFFILSCFFLNI